jgi:hypothetical protein
MFSSLAFAQDNQDWFLGKWVAEQGLDVYTLENFPDSTYTFAINTDQYIETGTWQLGEGQLTQNWNDPNTSEATSATYTLEKPSDTAFNQSGGNLPEGFVFAYVKATEENTEVAEVPFIEILPGSYSCCTSAENPLSIYAEETSLSIELAYDDGWTEETSFSVTLGDLGQVSEMWIGGMPLWKR